MMKCWTVRLISLTVSLLFLAGCAGSGLPDFPAKQIFVVRTDTKTCSIHMITKQDPITVDKGHVIPWDECPDVIGFDVKDSGAVFNWMRNAQSEAKKRCK